MKTILLLTLLVANVSAHAKRLPVLTAKYSGTFDTVIIRTSYPLRFEERAV